MAEPMSEERKEQIVNTIWQMVGNHKAPYAAYAMASELATEIDHLKNRDWMTSPAADDALLDDDTEDK